MAMCVLDRLSTRDVTTKDVRAALIWGPEAGTPLSLEGAVIPADGEIHSMQT